MERETEIIFENNQDIKDIEQRIKTFKSLVVDIGSKYYIEKIKEKQKGNNN